MSRRRWLLLSLAAVVLTTGGSVAGIAVGNTAAPAPLPNTIVAQHSDKCLTASGATGAVVQRVCAAATVSQQAFRLAPVNGETYTITPMDGGGCVGVRAGARANGTPVELSAACTGGAEQRFTRTKIADGVYSLRNEQSGRCVDVSGGSTVDGSAIIVWQCHSGRNQQWRLTPEAAPSPSPSGPEPTTSPSASPSASSSASPTAAPPVGECRRQPGPKPVVTPITLKAPLRDRRGEGDTAPLPLAIAATPSGGSWLAWLGTDKVYLQKLDCNDQLVGDGPIAFEGIDLQDVQADATGGVLLVTRRGECGTGPLCGGATSPCNTMHMIRFDQNGAAVWDRQVTNLSSTLKGYDNGARFIWWYQHHGRLASDGANYAAYFSVAITVKNGNCVDVHEGDRMQVVDANGALVPRHRDSFEVGCSHSWGTRIVWDPRTSHFVMVCATDNGCRIAQPNPYRTVVAGICDGTLFGGDLVLASTSGYWTAWSQGGVARLEHFTTGKSDTTITTGAKTSHPHLVSYGTDRMLLTWESGSQIAAQVYDAGSGAAVGDQFTIEAQDHDFQAFKAYSDGSVAYPSAGTSNTVIKIARVMPATS